MAYRLKPDPPLSKGVRRVARGQVEKALDELTGLAGEGAEEVVHGVRKRLKKVRALLRLANDGLGRKLSRREDARFRDAGRPLSEARDAAVLVDAFHALMERLGCPGHPEAADAVRSALLERKAEIVARLIREEKALASVTAALVSARRSLKRWEIDGEARDVLRSGLRRIYRDGIRAFRIASDDPTDENLHEWRKRVKDLGYVFELLPTEPADDRAELAKKLADLLGDDHDLAVLRGLLADDESPLVDSAVAVVILPLIDARRSELRGEALALGRSLHDEKARTFGRRLVRRWEAVGSEVGADRS